MDNLASSYSLQRIVITDVLVFLGMLLIPAISHVLPFPLYILDPMRMLVFSGYIFGRHHTNGLVLAMLMPIVSSFIVGHPVLAKAGLISIELIVNLYIFHLLIKHTKWHVFISIMMAIILSKAMYYLLKYLYIQQGWIDGALISTSLIVQLGTCVFVSIIMSIFYKRNSRTL